MAAVPTLRIPTRSAVALVSLATFIIVALYYSHAGLDRTALWQLQTLWHRPLLPSASSNIVHIVPARNRQNIDLFIANNNVTTTIHPLLCNLTYNLTCEDNHASAGYKVLHFFQHSVQPLKSGQWFIKADEDVLLYPELYELIEKLSHCTGPIQIWMVTMWGHHPPYPHGPIYAGNVYPVINTTQGEEDMVVGALASDDLQIYDISHMVNDRKYNTVYSDYCYILASHGRITEPSLVSGCNRFADNDVCSRLHTVGEYRRHMERIDAERKPIRSPIEVESYETDDSMLFARDALRGYLLRSCVVLHEAQLDDCSTSSTCTTTLDSYLQQTHSARALAELLSCKMVARSTIATDGQRLDQLLGDDIYPQYSTPGPILSLTTADVAQLLLSQDHSILASYRVFALYSDGYSHAEGSDVWAKRYLDGLLGSSDPVAEVTVVRMDSEEMGEGTVARQLTLAQVNTGILEASQSGCPSNTLILRKTDLAPTVAGIVATHTVAHFDNVGSALKLLRRARCLVTGPGLPTWVEQTKLSRTVIRVAAT